MVTPKIEIVGAEDVRGRLRRNLVGPPLARVLKDASAHAKNVAAKGVGGTTPPMSMMATVKPTSARVFSLMSAARVKSIETGRRPGGDLLHTGALKRWIRAVGYTGNPFVLAREIQRRGVRGRFFMRAAAQSTKSILPRLVNRMAGDVEKRWRRG